MSRLFLSGQTTCALLLGAGLLLRAQAALRSEPAQAPQQAARSAFERDEPPRASDRDLDGRSPVRLARPLRGPAHALRADDQVASAPREEHAASHPRKRRAQGRRHSRAHRAGSALAPGAERAVSGSRS